MRRVFVLGAGFSKAVAALPLTAEMIPQIRNLVQADLKSEEHDKREWAGWLEEFFCRAENRYLREPLRKHGLEVLSSNFFEDFELLLTLLDLNSTGTHVALVKDPNGKSCSADVGRTDVAHDHIARLAIEDFTYRVLWRERIPWDLLTRFMSRTKPGDTVITFNYDMLLERAMYVEGRWHPSNGYGITRFAPVPRWRDAPRDSPVTILKLHGSLNWDVGSGPMGFDLGNEPLLLHWFHDPDTPYFPDCVHAPDQCQICRPPRRDFGILPSLAKCFVNRPILDVWRKAHAALRGADEVIVIGYSLPVADSATWTLISTSMQEDQDVRVYAGNDADEIARRFNRAFGGKVSAHRGGLDEFLAS